MDELHNRVMALAEAEGIPRSEARRRIALDLPIVIDAAEYEQARRDPRVHRLWAEADRYLNEYPTT